MKELPDVNKQLEIVSDLEQLALTRSFIRNFCHENFTCTVDEKFIVQLELAVNEVVSNIIIHAYDGLNNQKIAIDASLYQDIVEVNICYLGHSFNPEIVSPPAFDGSRDNGFGVYIINECVDEVKYSHSECGKNWVFLKKVKGKSPWK